MPVYKSTMFFTGRSHDWTESWWQNESETDYTRPMDNLQALAAKRAKLLGKQCSIKALRVSREDEIGESYLKYVTMKGNAQEDAAEQDVAVLLTARDGLNKKRKHAFLRGVWDNVESEHGVYKRNYAGWKDAMTEFINTLTADGKGGLWGWYGVNTKDTAKITGYVVGADNRLTFTIVGTGLFTDLPATKKFSVRVSGINGRSGMNGVYVVNPITAFTCVTTQPYRSVPYSFGGVMTMNFPTFIQIKGASDQKITERKVGAPLLESHGHRRKTPKA